MELSCVGDPAAAGVRMGLWGAAQAVAFALGGLFATLTVDLVRTAFGSAVAAYGIVFGIQAALFVAAAGFAARVAVIPSRRSAAQPTGVIA